MFLIKGVDLNTSEWYWAIGFDNGQIVRLSYAPFVNIYVYLNNYWHYTGIVREGSFVNVVKYEYKSGIPHIYIGKED